MIDEASVLLSSRMVAFMLEPRRPAAEELLDLADGLDLAATVFRARGGNVRFDGGDALVCLWFDLSVPDQPSPTATPSPYATGALGKRLGGVAVGLQQIAVVAGDTPATICPHREHECKAGSIQAAP